MPFKSKAQMRLFFAKEKRGELPKGTAKRWAKHTKNISSLPERKKKSKKKAEATELYEYYCKVATALLSHINPNYPKALRHTTVANSEPAKPIKTNNQYTSQSMDPDSYLQNLRDKLGMLDSRAPSATVMNSLNAVKRHYGPVGKNRTIG